PKPAYAPRRRLVLLLLLLPPAPPVLMKGLPPERADARTARDLERDRFRERAEHEEAALHRESPALARAGLGSQRRLTLDGGDVGGGEQRAGGGGEQHGRAVYRNNPAHLDRSRCSRK